LYFIQTKNSKAKWTYSKLYLLWINLCYACIYIYVNRKPSLCTIIKW